MEEIWKDIKSYEGLYQVSNLGRIKSLKKIRRNGKGFYVQEEKLKTLQLWKEEGYYSIVLYKNDGGRTYHIHRLVAQAFIPNPENLPQVNHKDGNKSNNSVENLEWVTCSENVKHAYKKHLINHWAIGKFGKEHNFSKAVIQLDLQGNFINEYDSITQACEAMGVNAKNPSISYVCKGKQKTAYGYRWRYKED